MPRHPHNQPASLVVVPARTLDTKSRVVTFCDAVRRAVELQEPEPVEPRADLHLRRLPGHPRPGDPLLGIMGV